MRLLNPRLTLKFLRNAWTSSGPGGLPCMPLPQMYDSLQKYLRSARPFLSGEEFLKTECEINDFIKPGGVGEQLHNLLVCRAEKEENWLKDVWLNSAYLEFRAPVVVFSSPGEVFPKQNFKTDVDLIKAAANVIRASLDFKTAIDKKSINQEKLGGQLLDMVQYERIFGGCRLPCAKRDRIVYHPDSMHIIVMYENEIYKVRVQKEGSWLSPLDIFNQLKYISKKTSCSGPPIGALTADSRDVWANNYRILYEDAGNKKALKAIEESLFVVCIDQACSPHVVNDMTTVGAMILHGGGPKVNGSNRWFDKTVQIIMGRDGSCGICLEHTPAEAGPVASLTDFVLKRIDNEIDACPDDLEIDESIKPEKLCFQIEGDMKCAVEAAQDNFTKLVNDVELNCFCFNDFGKDCIKTFKVSPDSFIQMAIQFAFYRIHKKPGAQYESASLRKFFEGRTEAIRSCSEESVRFIKAMMDGCIPCQSKANAMRIALNSHKSYANAAMNAQGSDRYMLGLRYVAKEYNMVEPALFKDAGFIRSSHYRLSTSQVPTLSESFMVYAPLVPDGYGVCYNPRKANINFGTSSFVSCDSTSAAKFREVLESSLNEMRDTLIKSPQSKL